MSPDTDSPLPENGRGPARRQVLKAGVWAVPAISTMVAVPAAAASGPPSYTPQLGYTNFTVDRRTTYVNGHSVDGPPWWVDGYTAFIGVGGNTKVALPDYHSPAVTIGPITVVISVPVSAGFIATPATASGSGWSAGSASVSGSVVRYTFLWSGSIDTTDSRYTPELDFVLPATPANVNSISFPIRVDASASATGAITGLTYANAS